MNYWWVFDLLILAVIVFCVYFNAKKGFAEVIIRTGGYIIAVVAAAALSVNLASGIYEGYVKDKFIESMTEVTRDSNASKVFANVISEATGGRVRFTPNEIDNIMKKSENLDTRLLAAINEKGGTEFKSTEELTDKLIKGFDSKYLVPLTERVPEFVRSSVINTVSKSKNTFFNTMHALNEPPQAAAEYIEQNFLRSTAIKIINAVLFAVLVFVFMMIVGFVDKLTADRINIPILGKADTILGGVMGLIKAAVALLILTAGVYIVIAFSTSEKGMFSEAMVDKTIIFKHGYNIIKMIAK